MEKEIIFLIIYVVIMNILGIWIMNYDKQCAKKRRWRVPEKMLFLVSIIGGSIGTWLGMYLFRHKTKHWYFVIGMPMILIIHILLVLLLVKNQAF